MDCRHARARRTCGVRRHDSGRHSAILNRRFPLRLDYRHRQPVDRRAPHQPDEAAARSIKRIPIFGLGCVAGAAGIARPPITSRPIRSSRCVALRRIVFADVQREDLSLANLVSSGLFGDGAAAVVIAGSECEAQEGRRSSPRDRLFTRTPKK